MIYAENILVCIVVPLVGALLFLRGSARRFVFSFVIGMLICLLSAYITGFFRLVSGMNTDDTSIFISPVIEEIMKLLPVMFYVVMVEPTEDELLIAAIGIGTGFATFENCCYILSSGAENFSYILIRGMAVGVMHLVCMAGLSLGFNLLKRYKIFSFSGIMGALSLSMIFHALYNLLVSKEGLTSYVGYILPLLCAVGLYYLVQKNRDL